MIAGSLAATCAAVAVAHPAGDPRPLPVGAVAAGATVTREAGIEFVTITAPGNAAWGGTNPPTLGDRAVGRGRVDYEYKMARYEVTSKQWAEFLTAAYDRPPSEWIPHLFAPPNFWGGTPTAASTPGGLAWTTFPGNEMKPVGNIDFRMAAIYCNWLHNGKSLDRSAFLSGAYDVSTFGYAGPRGDIFTDQATRSPGAKFFIPTWDEWLKAAHYDPNKLGPGQGGWWTYANGLDRPAIANYPSAGGEANIGTGDPGILLGAYTNVMSPWGLFDTAGGMQEWTESITPFTIDRRRILDGSSFWLGPGVDNIGQEGADFPSFNFGDYGFRIAAAIPGPSALGLLAITFLGGARQRRR